MKLIETLDRTARRILFTEQFADQLSLNLVFKDQLTEEAFTHFRYEHHKNTLRRLIFIGVTLYALFGVTDFINFSGQQLSDLVTFRLILVFAIAFPLWFVVAMSPLLRRWYHAYQIINFIIVVTGTQVIVLLRGDEYNVGTTLWLVTWTCYSTFRIPFDRFGWTVLASFLLSRGLVLFVGLTARTDTFTWPVFISVSLQDLLNHGSGLITNFFVSANEAKSFLVVSATYDVLVDTNQERVEFLERWSGFDVAAFFQMTAMDISHPAPVMCIQIDKPGSLNADEWKYADTGCLGAKSEVAAAVSYFCAENNIQIWRHGGSDILLASSLSLINEEHDRIQSKKEEERFEGDNVEFMGMDGKSDKGRAKSKTSYRHESLALLRVLAKLIRHYGDDCVFASIVATHEKVNVRCGVQEFLGGQIGGPAIERAVTRILSADESTRFQVEGSTRLLKDAQVLLTEVKCTPIQSELTPLGTSGSSHGGSGEQSVRWATASSTSASTSGQPSLTKSKSKHNAPLDRYAMHQSASANNDDSDGGTDSGRSSRSSLERVSADSNERMKKMKRYTLKFVGDRSVDLDPSRTNSPQFVRERRRGRVDTGMELLRKVSNERRASVRSLGESAERRGSLRDLGESADMLPGLLINDREMHMIETKLRVSIPTPPKSRRSSPRSSLAGSRAESRRTSEKSTASARVTRFSIDTATSPTPQKSLKSPKSPTSIPTSPTLPHSSASSPKMEKTQTAVEKLSLASVDFSSVRPTNRNKRDSLTSRTSDQSLARRLSSFDEDFYGEDDTTLQHWWNWYRADIPELHTGYAELLATLALEIPHKWGRRQFKDDHLEQSFNHELAVSGFRVLQVAISMFMILQVLFVLYDVVAHPSLGSILAFCRVGLFCMVTTAVLVVMRTRFFRMNMQLVLFLAFCIFGIILVTITMFVGRFEPSDMQNYQVMLERFVVHLSSFSFLHVSQLVVVNTILWVIYGIWLFLWNIPDYVTRLVEVVALGFILTESGRVIEKSKRQQFIVLRMMDMAKQERQSYQEMISKLQEVAENDEMESPQRYVLSVSKEFVDAASELMKVESAFSRMSLHAVMFQLVKEIESMHEVSLVSTINVDGSFLVFPMGSDGKEYESLVSLANRVNAIVPDALRSSLRLGDMPVTALGFGSLRVVQLNPMEYGIGSFHVTGNAIREVMRGEKRYQSEIPYRGSIGQVHGLQMIGADVMAVRERINQRCNIEIGRLLRKVPDTFSVSRIEHWKDKTFDEILEQRLAEKELKQIGDNELMEVGRAMEGPVGRMASQLVVIEEAKSSELESEVEGLGESSIVEHQPSERKEPRKVIQEAQNGMSKIVFLMAWIVVGRSVRNLVTQVGGPVMIEVYGRLISFGICCFIALAAYMRQNHDKEYGEHMALQLAALVMSTSLPFASAWFAGLTGLESGGELVVIWLLFCSGVSTSGRTTTIGGIYWGLLQVVVIWHMQVGLVQTTVALMMVGICLLIGGQLSVVRLGALLQAGQRMQDDEITWTDERSFREVVVRRMGMTVRNQLFLVFVLDMLAVVEDVTLVEKVGAVRGAYEMMQSVVAVRLLTTVPIISLSYCATYLEQMRRYNDRLIGATMLMMGLGSVFNALLLNGTFVLNPELAEAILSKSGDAYFGREFQMSFYGLALLVLGVYIQKFWMYFVGFSGIVLQLLILGFTIQNGSGVALFAFLGTVMIMGEFASMKLGNGKFVE